MLPPSFFEKLKTISADLGIKAEDLLLVMTLESGLNPRADNPNGHASGLVQVMPKFLKNFGFHGDPAAFRDLTAEKQLDYVKNQYSALVKYNGGPFQSAAQMYLANFFPVSLKLPGVKNKDFDTVIIESEPEIQKYKGVDLKYEAKVYAANKGLDSDKDGKITYGDIEKKMNEVRNRKVYKDAIQMLNANIPAVEQEPKFENPEMAKINDLLNKFLGNLK